MAQAEPKWLFMPISTDDSGLILRGVDKNLRSCGMRPVVALSSRFKMKDIKTLCSPAIEARITQPVRGSYHPADFDAMAVFAVSRSAR